MSSGSLSRPSRRDPNHQEGVVNTKTQVSKIATVVIPVADQDGQISFYVDKLGF